MLRFNILLILALLLPVVSFAGLDSRCEVALTEEDWQMAVYIIDYGGGSEDGSFGEVTVIRDRDPSEQKKDESEPRPEMDVPRPEPGLQIITPTPTREKAPVPVVIPELPRKTPPKPYLN